MGRAQRSPCFQCRCRKVRCDRRPSKCGNCERLDFTCSFTQDTATPARRAGPKETVEDWPERRRGTQACIECRRQKARCSGGFPECTSCHRRQRPCQYPKLQQSDRSSIRPDEPQTDKAHGHDLIVPRDELMQSIENFFQHLYPLPFFAFLHEPTVRRQCEDGSLDDYLALSIMTVTKLWLSPDQKTSKQNCDWIEMVEMQIWSHLEKPCIRRLQCLLLVIHCHIHLGHFSRAYMLAGLAARAATALRLNYERPELSFVAQETRRRVLWTLSSIDGFFSVGLPEYETIPHTIIYQRLPSTEEAFWGGNAEGNLADHQPPLEALSSGGGSLLAACIRLSKISKDIMRLTRQLALSEQPLAQLGGFIQEIQNDLWRLRADIQLSFNYQVESSTRIFAMTGSRWFARFLQITVTWHQAHCDLYRLFLPEYQEAAPKIIMDSIEPSLKDNALQKCEEHVHHINEIIQGLLHLTSTPILPSYLAICCYQATRLSLFLAASPILRVQLDAATAVENANLALAVLERFFSNSPSVGKIVLDIQHLLQLSHTQPGSIYRELCCLSPPFDQGRHRHSHLAVHSLVRQANFVDDGYEDYDD